MEETKNKKFKLTCYLAGAIEHANPEQMEGWREEITKKLEHPDLLIYDPIKQESVKTGKETVEQVKYITGLKKAGKFDIFFNEVWKIYFGAIAQNSDLIQLFLNLRMRKFIDGNTLNDIQYWGDAEAVIRSDFIIVYYPKAVQTVGTIFEVILAMLFRIPIYLILPDHTKTEANSSMLFFNQIANTGNLRVFYSINECVKAIKEDFNKVFGSQ